MYFFFQLCGKTKYFSKCIYVIYSIILDLILKTTILSQTLLGYF